MKHTTIPYFAVLVVIIYGTYNALTHTPKTKQISQQTHPSSVRKETLQHIKKELAHIDTPQYTYQYIINVIDHGSNDLHFNEKETMEAGFASKEDAPKIACYVLSLSNESCGFPYAKDAAMYYTSNCAGCHGEDGKGIHGTYPDLTRRPLLGIEKRKDMLIHLLKQQTGKTVIIGKSTKEHSMKKELKEIWEKSEKVLDEVEDKIEDMGEEVADDAKAYWKELKSYLKNVGKKLKHAYEDVEGDAELKAHLLLMEVRDKMDELKDEIDTFVTRATHKSEQELDIIALKAHLAKMDAEDLLEEKEKEFSHLYATSKAEAELLSKKALKEINALFVKLTEVV